MGSSSFLLSCSLLVSLSLGHTARSDAEILSCKKMGFHEFLSCSDCKDLETFVNNPDIVKECLSCCSSERQDASAQKFRAAILEYCPHSLSYVGVRSVLCCCRDTGGWFVLLL